MNLNNKKKTSVKSNKYIKYDINSNASLLLKENNAIKEINESSVALRGFSNASPGIRKFARELGVDLENVAGTNKHGRISEHDVKHYVNNVLTTNTNNSNNDWFLFIR